MVGTIRFGSICLDGEMVLPGSVCVETPEITFGDTGQDHMSLKWLRDINGNFVAVNCIVLNISWHDLDRQGYISGCPVFIDGQGYLCRSLQVGRKEGDINEWDDLLDRYGDDPASWGDPACRFWGQEADDCGQDRKAVLRGGNSLRSRLENFTSNRNGSNQVDYSTYCFRPVLEPLPVVPALDDSPIGIGLEVYGPSGAAIKGTLASFDDYDLCVANPIDLPGQAPDWAIKKGESVLISRDSIVWMRTIPTIPAKEG